jgi:type I restriction-modification system DNA methylase subunit
MTEADPGAVLDRLVAALDRLVAALDREAERPPEAVVEDLRAVARELEGTGADDRDLVGRVYEEVVPVEQRREMGEYYTPPAVCDLLTRLTVEEADDTVLDPACGTGRFLVSAYRRLSELLAASGEPGEREAGRHERVLTQIAGVEANPVPAGLAAAALAMQDGSAASGAVDAAAPVRVSDFFDVDAGERYDAVVGNPPYVRQEEIDDKAVVRTHLSNEAVDAEYLSARSDLYAYFLTHATEFLADGGNLGFVTSDRWLDTRYGADLQRFVLDNYEVRAVLTFDRQAFDDALVDASVLILRRQSDSGERDGNVAKFVRLKREMDVDDVAELVEQDSDPDRLVAARDYRLVTRRQSALQHENKWNVFFLAPPVYFDLDAHPDVVELSEIAEVSYGLKTGANPFFYGHTDEMEARGLGPYTSPALKATGQVDRVEVTDGDAEEWRLLDVHDLVAEATDGAAGSGTTDVEQVKAWLDDNGHDALLEYVERGEDDGYDERASVSNRDVWFDLGELPRPRILSTMFTWRTHRVFWNEANAATSDQFNYVRPDEDVDEKLLAALLNSRAVWLSNELEGRWAGGQGMTRLQTKVYETEQWAVPDPRSVPADAADEIRAAFDDLRAAERATEEPTQPNTAAERDRLDRAVLEPLGMGDRLDELATAVDAMVSMREEGAGGSTSVLVGRDEPDAAAVLDLPDGGAARGRTTTPDGP